jgi:formimidoylglutamate deiminase
VGETLLHGVAASAQSPTGHDIGTLESGRMADAVVLDTEAPQLVGARDENTVDRWLFSGNRNLVDQVFVGGKRVVDGGRHHDRQAIATRYRSAMEALLAD